MKRIFVKQHDAKDCAAACLSMVCLHYKKETTITQLRDKMETDLKGINLVGLSKCAGDGLSGGEKQRITHSPRLSQRQQLLHPGRIHKQPRLRILDMIYYEFRHKTMLIIAHRLSTIKDCDTIIVLDKGKIIEQGTHEELLALDGEYHKLWEMQQGNSATEKRPRKGDSSPKKVEIAEQEEIAAEEAREEEEEDENVVSYVDRVEDLEEEVEEENVMVYV